MSHTYPNILLHVVFSTKERRPIIDVSFRQQLYEYLCGIARKEFGRALRIGGTENHIHGLLSIGTDISVGEAMSKWKSLSSGWVHRTFPKASDFKWQEGYGVFSVSKSLVPTVERYIAKQGAHHQRQTFEEEFVEFLVKHEIEFDPKELWTQDYAG